MLRLIEAYGLEDAQLVGAGLIICLDLLFSW
jgi:hypothetical protein